VSLGVCVGVRVRVTEGVGETVRLVVCVGDTDGVLVGLTVCELLLVAVRVFVDVAESVDCAEAEDILDSDGREAEAHALALVVEEAHALAVFEVEAEALAFDDAEAQWLALDEAEAHWLGPDVLDTLPEVDAVKLLDIVVAVDADCVELEEAVTHEDAEEDREADTVEDREADTVEDREADTVKDNDEKFVLRTENEADAVAVGLSLCGETATAHAASSIMNTPDGRVRPPLPAERSMARTVRIQLTHVRQHSRRTLKRMTQKDTQAVGLYFTVTILKGGGGGEKTNNN
jgi:hypothetical protein